MFRLPEVAEQLELALSSESKRRLTALTLPFHLGGVTWQPPSDGTAARQSPHSVEYREHVDSA